MGVPFNVVKPAGAAGFRAAIHESQRILFAMVGLSDPGVATIVGSSGIDAVVLDAEHGPFTIDTLRHSLSAIEQTRAYSAVRVAGNDRALIKQVLDLGPDAILAPAISSAAEAIELVRSCRYPPEGVRGMGTGRANRYGLDQNYRQRANFTTAVLALVETGQAIDNIKAICAVPGLDGILIGPTDLAASLGVAPGSDELEVAIAHITEAAVAAGRPVGTNAPPERIDALVEQGMSLFVCYADFSGLSTSATAAARTARGRGAP